ncbi:MAG: hypothetical protein M9892_09245 [Bacteroidetes bacterium]|jgi:hypothetical protein|nr:hypothetical protein [Bacteroidota bacterium]
MKKLFKSPKIQKGFKLLVASFVLALVPNVAKSQNCNAITNLNQFYANPVFYGVTYLHIEVRNGNPYAYVYDVSCYGQGKFMRKCRKKDGLCARGKVWADLSGSGDILEMTFALPTETGYFDPENQIQTEIYECEDEEGVYVTYEL